MIDIEKFDILVANLGEEKAVQKTVPYTWNRKPMNGVTRKPYTGVLVTDTVELERLSKLRSDFRRNREVARQCEVVAELLAAFKLTGQVDNRRQAATPISEFLERSWRLASILDNRYKIGGYVICLGEFMRIEKITDAFWLNLKDGSGKTHWPINPSVVSKPQ